MFSNQYHWKRWSWIIFVFKNNNFRKVGRTLNVRPGGLCWIVWDFHLAVPRRPPAVRPHCFQQNLPCQPTCFAASVVWPCPGIGVGPRNAGARAQGWADPTRRKPVCSTVTRTPTPRSEGKQQVFVCQPSNNVPHANVFFSRPNEVRPQAEGQMLFGGRGSFVAAGRLISGPNFKFSNIRCSRWIQLWNVCSISLTQISEIFLITTRNVKVGGKNCQVFSMSLGQDYYLGDIIRAEVYLCITLVSQQSYFQDIGNPTPICEPLFLWLPPTT